MPDTNSKDAWYRFQADMKTLASELRRHYKDTDDEKNAAEINRSLQKLGEAAEAFFQSLDTVSRDPEVRASTKQAARSFGTALAGTLREVSDELDAAFRRPPAPK